MRVINEGPWYEGEDLENAPDIAELTTRAFALMGEHRCILCGKRLANDEAFAGYAMEVADPATGRSVDIEYRACRKCESRVDAMAKF